MPLIIYRDLGLIKYKDALSFQENIFNNLLRAKANNRENSDKKELINNYLIFCEHYNVYTLGKSGDAKNLLIDSNLLSLKDAEFIKSNRGGDITYHGPGQIVGYPIFDLEQFSLGIKDYIFNIEESIILMLNDIGIKSERLEGATGVWLDTNSKNARKICAIGVKASRHITMHGFALNVNTDLSYFNYINPCGFTDKKVTSIEKELGEKQNIEEIKLLLKSKLINVFNL